MTNPIPAVKLNNGRKMPVLGLGVSRIPEGEKTEQAVRWALEAGYRHIDTAKLYGNEASVGDALQKSNVSRDEVWITTKLWPTDFARPEAAFESSLKRLGLTYIDLYLIHRPTPISIPGFDKKIWKFMERLAGQGLCKTIGVSNYSANRLQKTLQFANIPPAVNQVRFSPFHYPVGLHKFCQENGVVLEGYMPLNRGRRLDNKTLKEIADKYNKLPTQIILRWATQKGVVVIPRSEQKNRIQANSKIFDFVLSDDDMQKLTTLSHRTQLHPLGL